MGNIIIYIYEVWMGSPNPIFTTASKGRSNAQSVCPDRQAQTDQQAVVITGGGRTADAGAGWWVWAMITSMTTYLWRTRKFSSTSSWLWLVDHMWMVVGDRMKELVAWACRK